MNISIDLPPEMLVRRQIFFCQTSAESLFPV